MSRNKLPEYVVADPTGNITVLVTEQVPLSLQAELGEALLRAEPTAEQVGFVSDIDADKVSLRMAGGEFCANASMSAAALTAEVSGIDDADVTVRVWGTEPPVKARVRRDGGQWYGTVTLPLPESIGCEVLSIGGKEFSLPLVKMPGIGHIIVEGGAEFDIEAAAALWCAQLALPALGIMEIGGDSGALAPLVYVREIESLYHESSCASGTCAAAAYLSGLGRGDRFSFTEPGGVLEAEVGDDVIKLSGTVRFLNKANGE